MHLWSRHLANQIHGRVPVLSPVPLAPVVGNDACINQIVAAKHASDHLAAGKCVELHWTRSLSKKNVWSVKSWKRESHWFFGKLKRNTRTAFFPRGTGSAFKESKRRVHECLVIWGGFRNCQWKGRMALNYLLLFRIVHFILMGKLINNYKRDTL